MDPLSDLLSVVRLSGVLFFDVELAEPWHARSPPPGDLLGVLTGARHLMSYHVVIEGTVWAHGGKTPPVRMGPGTMVVFPHGDPHSVGSDPLLGDGQLVDTTMVPLHLRPPYLVRGGGGGTATAKMLCGFFGCDAKPFNPLLESLPQMLVVSATAPEAGDLGVFFRLAVGEANAKSPGGAATLGRLGELMLIEAIRRYMLDAGAPTSGWLAGMTNPKIGEALRAIHADPTNRWTLQSLARCAGMSRSGFASEFQSLVGLSPMAYVTGWRMQIAASCLAAGGTVSNAAERAGYESDAAFSRAFRRMTGISPGAWQRGDFPNH